MLRAIPVAQQTIGGEVQVAGTGVFTGQACEVTLSPAPPDHGLVFHARQADGTVAIIPVSPAALHPNPNRTTLCPPGEPSRGVTMVEHVLSALHGLGIDNAVIAVFGHECPLRDGSARDFLAGIAAVGVVAQDAQRQILCPMESITLGSGDATLTLTPPTQDMLSIDYTLAYDHPLIGQRRVQYQLTPALYRDRIGISRTFIPIAEVEQLIAAGVLRSTESDCLVVWPDHTNHPLHHPEEFADHKVLDLIGDLRLCGYPVWADVTGVRSGHGLNQEAARWLAAQVS